MHQHCSWHGSSMLASNGFPWNIKEQSHQHEINLINGPQTIQWSKEIKWNPRFLLDVSSHVLSKDIKDITSIQQCLAMMMMMILVPGFLSWSSTTARSIAFDVMKHSNQPLLIDSDWWLKLFWQQSLIDDYGHVCWLSIYVIIAYHPIPNTGQVEV